jgi:hypothetical protein
MVELAQAVYFFVTMAVGIVLVARGIEASL